MNVIDPTSVMLAADQGNLDVTFQPNWLGLVIGVVLPILVGLVTKVNTNAGVKAVLLLLLSAVNGFLTEYVNAATSSANYDWATALYTWGGSFALAVAVHFGIYKPAKISEAVQKALVK